jgi:3-phosphoglycerate kinase
LLENLRFHEEEAGMLLLQKIGFAWDIYVNDAFDCS